jgi:hypothetical protein
MKIKNKTDETLPRVKKEINSELKVLKLKAL